MLECSAGGALRLGYREGRWSMFERFTDKARRTVVLAQEEARLLRHDYVGTEHILLGLLRERGGVAARVLTSLGISLEAARERLEAAVGRGQATSGHIPFTRQAKRTLELALREALHLGDDYIGTEHILLGLLRDADGRGTEILVGLGADLNVIRQRVIQTIGRASDPSRLEEPGVRRARSWRLGESAGELESLHRRLAAVEHWAGMTTAPDQADLDHEVSRLRREKEAAIDAQDFKAAEALSDSETELLVERDRRSQEWTSRPSLADDVAQLRAEVARLTLVLRDHGLDADGSA
jgi:Clp amino terminal domain, pathogenicity island component